MKKDFKTLKDLHEYYAVNNDCALKEVATQPVYEIEPPAKGIVFIGEAPGKNEDLQGVPFVGASGRLLDTLLTETAFERKDIYITNVVKYRPPNNRDPHDSEKKSCRLWLNAELMFVKPSVIIPLGRHALEKFVPDQKISMVHGQSFEHTSGIPIFAMYHPAVGLYNPNLKSTLLEDFEKLRVFLDNGSKVENKLPEESKMEKKDSKKDKEVEDILQL